MKLAKFSYLFIIFLTLIQPAASLALAIESPLNPENPPSVPSKQEQSAQEINDANYLEQTNNLTALQNRIDNAIITAKLADLNIPFAIVQKHYQKALIHKNTFNCLCLERKYTEAATELAAARQEFSLSYALSIPPRSVEARALWLDRGTIVACQNPQGLSKLFDRLQKAGVNVIYFETNNAGFTMFPSHVSTENPQITGWDPLACAVNEAHKHSMEIHAWIWVFNVDNLYHNSIIGQATDYPGPVLSKTNFARALASSDGSFTPPKQHELWLDPSNAGTRDFIKDLISEVVKNYNIDGIQLDYIRYPFNGKGVEMGFNWSGRKKFEHDTLLYLDELNDATRLAWINWKADQINSLVKEISDTVHAISPNIRISAAVYALPRAQRLTSIQQDWEQWVKNGWVDTLNPMTYVKKGTDLERMAEYVQLNADNQALVYPGIFLKDIDNLSLIEQLDVSRTLGLSGNTMFAAAQLNELKADLLSAGPYSSSPLTTPQAHPFLAATTILDELSSSLNNYVIDPEYSIVADRAVTNEVLKEVASISQHLHSLPSTISLSNINNKQSSLKNELISLNNELSSFQKAVDNWLLLDSFAGRSQRTQYIKACLNECHSILGYAAHKVQLSGSNQPLISDKNKILKQ